MDAVQGLLLPLEKEGVLVKRSRNELEAMMHDFIVVERETKVRTAFQDSLSLYGRSNQSSCKLPTCPDVMVLDLLIIVHLS